MASRSLGHRAPLLWLVMPLMAGLALGRARDSLPVGWLLGGAGAGVGLAVVAAWRGSRGWAAAMVAALVLAGAASYALNRPRLNDWDALPPREATLSVHLDRTFASADARKISGLGTVTRADGPLHDLGGQRVYLSIRLGRRQAVPIQGAVLSLRGVLASLPRDPPVQTFDGYLAGAGINFKLLRGKMLAEEQAAPPYRRFCARMLDQLSAGLGLGVARKRPALVGVLRAMMLGQQHELSPEQKTLFRQSGTMHIFSISGLHIAVIALSLQALLSLARLPRAVRLVIALVALWLYVDITGTAPSAVRAYVMVAFVQVALALRVARNPVSAQAASALIVLLASPLDLFGASFQMSYGIVAALLLLGLPLADRWQEAGALFADLPRVSWQWHHQLRDAASRATLSAAGIGAASALVGAVTGVQFFELFTPGALLVNLWLIPASSLVIMLGFVSLLCGLVGLTAGCSLANHAAVLVLWGVERGVSGNLRIPGMWFAATFRAAWIGPISLTALLAVILAGYAQGWRGWCRGFWPPFAVVVVTLAFGVKFGAP